MTARDFTLDVYGALLETVVRRHGSAVGVCRWHQTQGSKMIGCVIRHDVDRRPANALRMAQLEAAKGIATTYYFRVVGEAYDIGTIERIAALGHEVGYHYEDLALADGDMPRALESFDRHLRKLRAHVDIRTVAMHGSPLSKFNNLDIWKAATLDQYSLVADAFLTVDYRGMPYFTDTGRDWSGRVANLRDCPPTASLPPTTVRATADLVNYIQCMPEAALALSIHPERWDNHRARWLIQLVKDRAANAIKRILSFSRGALTDRPRT
jgi:hypothetical protein